MEDRGSQNTLSYENLMVVFGATEEQVTTALSLLGDIAKLWWSEQEISVNKAYSVRNGNIV